LAEFSFDAEVVYWRGPAPFFFAAIPADLAAALRQAAKQVSYGWGVVPVEAVIAGVSFRTSLFPKDDTYLLPIKVAVRRKTNVTAGDTIAIEMTLQSGRRAL
jgi:hypothetical protein